MVLRYARLAVAVLALMTGTAAVSAEHKICLWRVENGDATVQLLGSLHALRASMYPLYEPIDDAFDAADTVVFEVDLTRISRVDTSLAMQRRGTYPRPESIERHLSPPTLALLHRYLAEEQLEFSDLRHMRPWYLGLYIEAREMEKLGFEPGLGIDQHYQRLAAEEGKEIRQLETFEKQLEIMAADPPSIQDLSLRVSLEELPTLGEKIEGMMALWRTGDVDGMYRVAMQSISAHPEIKGRVSRSLDQRNVEMARRISEYLQGNGNYLVVVGALHMGGERGLVALLSREHSVEQQSVIE